HAHEHTGSAGAFRPSLRNGFTAYNVLFPENGSFASVVSGTLPANLAPAPRRPNHTTSPYASGAFVYCAISVHRISPRVRDDGQRPSSAVGQAALCDCRSFADHQVFGPLGVLRLRRVHLGPLPCARQ